jgi:xanthine phosphoribosyltransferase
MPTHSAHEEILISWEQLHRDAHQLAQSLSHQSWKGIIAVTRGGLIPAALLAHQLNIKLIETICISSYEEKSGPYAQRINPEIIKSFEGDSDSYLLVDDLVDSGKTAAFVKALAPKAHLATLYAKPAGMAYANTFVREYPQNQWIIFPWEAKSP